MKRLGKEKAHESHETKGNDSKDKGKREEKGRSKKKGKTLNQENLKNEKSNGITQDDWHKIEN
jgi:hypothetical protein